MTHDTGNVEEPVYHGYLAGRPTIPAEGRLCHHDIEFEGDRDTGVWYVHE